PRSAARIIPPLSALLFLIVSIWIDGDPHFVVQLPKLTFNIQGTQFLNVCPLPPQGIIVDGHLMGAPSKHGAEERTRTYFDRLTISSATGGSGDIMITLSLDAVVVEGEGQDHLPINQQGSVIRQGVTVAVDNHQSCWIELAKDVRFLVLFHHYKQPSYLQMAHLGFYITDGRGLSASSQGLLGTYAHTSSVTLCIAGFNIKGQIQRKMTLGVNNTCAESTVLWDMDPHYATVEMWYYFEPC
uniref:Inter-alpha-trypsin inhibitor heavy chain family member 6 n=1 Tax=Sander lucioperca TaxID=283035 RepID=A0A8D0D9S2_SANLU